MVEQIVLAKNRFLMMAYTGIWVLACSLVTPAQAQVQQPTELVQANS